jgi:hypothetical protein
LQIINMNYKKSFIKENDPNALKVILRNFASLARSVLFFLRKMIAKSKDVAYIYVRNYLSFYMGFGLVTRGVHRRFWQTQLKIGCTKTSTSYCSS